MKRVESGCGVVLNLTLTLARSGCNLVEQSRRRYRQWLLRRKGGAGSRVVGLKRCIDGIMCGNFWLSGLRHFRDFRRRGLGGFAHHVFTVPRHVLPLHLSRGRLKGGA